MLAGLISGFCSSAPLGPINLWLVEAVIENTRRSIKWFLAGVICTDLAFAAVAIWGYYEFFQDSKYANLAQIVMGFFLLGIGIVTFWQLRNPREERKQKSPIDSNTTAAKSFFMGSSLCGSNPGFLIFWLFVVNFISENLSVAATILTNLVFLLGVALGDGLWFTLLVKLVRKGLNLAKPKILLSIRYGICFGFFCFGSVTLWRGIH